MPGILELAGNEYEPLTAADVGAAAWQAGVYYAVPPVGPVPRESAAEYERVPLTFPGVDGVATRNLGFRGRNIMTELIFLAATCDEAQAAKSALWAGIQGVRVTVTVPGGTQRAGCLLREGGLVERRWLSVQGMHGLVCALNMRQMNL